MRDYSVKTDRDPESIRRDASVNRKAIIVRARKVLAINPDASLTQIAKEAGVSRATLYRNFPDKDTVILEVFRYNLDVLQAYSDRILGEAGRFFKLMEVVIEQQANYQSLASRLTKMDEEIVERVYTIFEDPIKDAVTSRQLRADFDMRKDLMLLLMMIGGSLLMYEEGDNSERVKRALQFVLEGVRR